MKNFKKLSETYELNIRIRDRLIDNLECQVTILRKMVKNQEKIIERLEKGNK